jgi:hypothetical protein
MMVKMASINRKLDAHPAYVASLTMPNLLIFIEQLAAELLHRSFLIRG